MKEKGPGCGGGGAFGRPTTVMLTAQPNCKIADLLCLAEMQSVHLKYYPNDLAST